jgi:transposase
MSDMNAEARIAELEAKVAELLAEKAAWQGEAKELRVQLAQALAQIGQLLARVHELEGRIAKDSHSSSKPPSSDGLARKTRSQRAASEKRSGGQPGHEGHHLKLVETPDEIMRHRPSHCEQCQQSLEGVDGEVVERRQVQDLPPVRLVVSEHQVEEVRCPHCQQVSRGRFPEGVSAPAQYGTGVKALAVYLHQYQLVPLERMVELLQDVCRCRISEGTLVSWEQEAASRLEPTMEQIAERVVCGRLQHADETGMRLGGKLHWVHVNSTRFLTHLAWHQKRGRAAVEAIGIWPRFRGRAMHDRWKSYDGYACAHSVCCAHLLRELTYLSEHEQQKWAADLKDLLLSMHAAAQQWREQGAGCVPPAERDAWVAQYFEVLAHGYGAQPLPPGQAPPPRKKGRRKQSAAKNLLDDLLGRADQVLAFLDDLALPFTNNQAERDLRMIKVQQKIAGTFRSEAGATAFCYIRSYLSTMRKQGHSMLDALTAVFTGKPLAVAWGIE